MVICLQIPTTLWTKWMNCFSQTLNVHRVSGVRQTRVRYMQLSRYYLILVLLRLKLLMQSWKDVNRQVVIKLQQNWIKQEVKHYALRSINILIMFGIGNNCLISGRSLLLYQFTGRVMKLTVVIIVGRNLLPISHRILTNILPQKLSPFVEEIAGNHECGFLRNKSTTYQFFCHSSDTRQ
jgi:hypothetical protein